MDLEKDVTEDFSYTEEGQTLSMSDHQSLMEAINVLLLLATAYELINEKSKFIKKYLKIIYSIPDYNKLQLGYPDFLSQVWRKISSSGSQECWWSKSFWLWWELYEISAPVL